MPDDKLIREQERLASLERYDVLDTPPEEAFDRITRLIRLIFDVPIATVTLVDGHRLWFKSQQGLSETTVSRSTAICNAVIDEAAPLVLFDTVQEPRFCDNIHVTHGAKIRFYAGYPLQTPEGHTVGVLCAMDSKPRHFEDERLQGMADLARIVVNELELRSIAAVDSLTGALSRRAFSTEGDRALSLARRYSTDLSCISFDLDHFKTINDTFGHATGDSVLRACADACRSVLRKTDLLGRIGGEEFAVLLPHTDCERARKVAEKLRAAIAAAKVLSPSSDAIRVTASFGVAVLDRGMPRLADLLQRADEALYQAKGSGRNRCVAAPTADSTTPVSMQRVLKSGRIVLKGGYSTIDCTVRGLSDTGATIDVVTTTGIPDRFDLLIGPEKVGHPSQIVSKRDRRIELRFTA